MAPSTRSRSSTASPNKRKSEIQENEPKTPKKAKSAPKKAVPATPNPAPSIASGALVDLNDLEDAHQIILRPKLSFDYQQAKKHLIAADIRFKPLMNALPCKPFEEESDLNPFRALCCSILGQQISWLAARSITHKFIRLVAFPDLPEKPEPTGMTTHFPTPKQVATAPMETLRSAGLSGRKAEYVQDLAMRFADGRLSAAKLMEMDDEEVMKELIQIRGVGKWTVEMFMIFTLRRPNVLPCGDLGIQKGLVRWFSQPNPMILSKKLPDTPSASPSKSDKSSHPLSALPIAGLHATTGERQATPEQGGDTGDYSDIPSTPMGGEVDPTATHTPQNGSRPPLDPQAALVDVPLMTPRTEKEVQLPPFPESKTLDSSSLKGRLNKKIKGNIYLSPQEMEELTESWKPYRSVGIWYLWSIADADTSFG